MRRFLLIVVCVYILVSGGCWFGEFKKNFKGWKSVHFNGTNGPTAFAPWSQSEMYKDPIEHPYMTPMGTK
jgi:hypothetical protein